MQNFDTPGIGPENEEKRDVLSEASFSSEIRTIEQWDQLPVRKKMMHLAGGDVPRELQYVCPEESSNPIIIEFAARINEKMNTLCNTTHRAGYDEHWPKGDPIRETSLILLPDGTPLGGHISIWQEGEPALEGPSEDISWSASGYFNHDGEAISVDECLFWSGY